MISMKSEAIQVSVILKTKILGLTLFVSATVLSALDPAVESTLRNHLNERLDRELNQSIVVGIVSNYGEEYITVGTLERDGQNKPDKDTLYDIGGVTKVFTAATTADLVQARQLTWKTTAAALLPQGAAPPVFDGQAINLHQLATHSSGLPPLPLGLKPDDPANPLAGYDAKALYENLPQTGYAFRPGTNYLHSELGYGLLGHLLELRTGETYEAVVQERITGPLGLEDTVVTLSEEQQTRLAPPHEGLSPAPLTDWGVLQGAGALKSSAANLATFLKAQMGLIKTPKATAFSATHTPILPTGAQDTMVGRAWQVTSKEGITLYWHNGLSGGYASFIGFNPGRRVGVVILTNTSLSVDEIGFYVLAPEVFPLGSFSPLPRLPVETLLRYTGTYAVSPEARITISREGQNLYCTFSGGARYRLYPISDKLFGFAKGGITLSFDAPGKRGQAKSLTVNEKLSSYAAKRVDE